MRPSALAALARHVGAWVLYSPFQQAFDGNGYFLEGVGARWTSPASFDLSRPVFRWTRDADALSDEGLGAGITWGMHPDFCNDVIPAFREERFFFNTVQFMTCDSLRHAIDVAFETWASNHRFINFKDVTAECAAPGAIDASGHCRFAEVTIAAQHMDGPMHDSAAFVRFDTTRVGFSPTTTAGDVVTGGLGARRAQIKFATSLCWYLDATFCSMFHALGRIDPAFVGYVRLATFGCFGLALSSLLWIASTAVASAFGHANAYEAVRKTCCRSAAQRALAQQQERRSTNMRWRTLLDYLTKMPLFGLLCSLFWTIFMPVFYNSVFVPCAECYGFSGVLAHEAGHLLGFQHPDVYAAMNLRASGGAVMNASTCRRPLDHVELHPLAEGTDTVMNSIAAHRPTTCLTADDLEGLNFLYPTCDEAAEPRAPICTKPLRLTGYLRLLIAVFVPYSVVTLVVLGLLAFVRWLQREHVAQLRANVHRRSQQGAWLRAGMRASWVGASNAPALGAADGRRALPGRMRRSLTRAVLPGAGGESLVKSLFGRAVSRRAGVRASGGDPSKPRTSFAGRISRRSGFLQKAATRRGGDEPRHKREHRHHRHGRHKNGAFAPVLDTVAELSEAAESQRAGGAAVGPVAATAFVRGGPPVARVQKKTALTTDSLPSTPSASSGSDCSSGAAPPPRRRAPAPDAQRPHAQSASAAAVARAPPGRGAHPREGDQAPSPKATRLRAHAPATAAV